jgi:DNA-binding transcriptional ArsR family regulator
MASAPNPSDRTLVRLRDLYRALGDASRLRICALLADAGPLTVSELVLRVGLSQPLISWHLRIMRLAGVIETERIGRETHCRLRPEVFEEMTRAQARLLAGSLEADAAPATGKVPDVG